MIHHKICFLGASAVGKTSLIRRYVDGIFSDKYLTTIGVKIDKKQLSIQEKNIELLIWDLEGTDKFCGFQTRYLKGASAYVLVVDQSRPSSFNDALAIFNLITAEVKAPKPLGFLVINKSDLATQLTEQDTEQLNKMDFITTIRTSAKSGDNVEALFLSIGQTLIAQKAAHG